MTKHIYIYSPSGAVRDKAAFRRGVARLRSLGHEVEVDPDALTSFQRFAGDDATRVAAIHRAAASRADVALISRGGYGLTRVLPQLRYRAIASAIARGTQFVGISDFTALQCALLAKTGAITWAGPGLCEGFGAPILKETDAHKGLASGPDDIMEACFDDLLSGQGEGTGWRQRPCREAPARSSAVAATAQAKPMHVKAATLWGGNLTVLCSLLGTPYFPQVKGGVLFLEDVGEHPYRLERMLTQLLHAGVLASQKAIALGQFTAFQLTAHDRGFKLASVVQWLRQHVKTPVLTNLPYGHVPTKVLLPVGRTIELVVEGADVLLLWNHQH